MSKLPGTVIANTAIDNLGIEFCGRLYTQKRANDRSHKLYGSLTTLDANRLVQEITALGGRNARIVWAHNYYTNKDYITGVRFEVAK